MMKRILGFVVALACLGAVPLFGKFPGPDLLKSVCDQALELGFETGELHMLQGSYRSHIFGQSAEGQFIAPSRPDLGKIRIAVSRPLSFLPWRLVAYSHEHKQS